VRSESYSSTAVRGAAAGVNPESRGAVLPRVSALVLNWCSREDTAACIGSLLDSEYPALDVTLIDNGSPDGSGEAVHAMFPQVHYLQTRANLGYTGGNNRGIERVLQSGCDYVLVLNNDTLVERDAVRRLVEAAAADPRIGAVGPKILYADDPRVVWFAGGDLVPTRAMGYHRDEGRLDTDLPGTGLERVSFLTGCCLLVPAAVLRQVGGFEEDFFAYVEDVDFCLRLTRAGYSLVYQPSARIHHRVPRLSTRPTPFQIEHGTRNRRRFARRRLAWLDRVRFALFFYPSRLVHLVGYVARGDLARARALMRGLATR
jgi:GT2 family glycosyltransferase